MSNVGRYLLKEKSDDSILLILIIRIMDALGNYGNGYGLLMNRTPFVFESTLQLSFILEESFSH